MPFAAKPMSDDELEKNKSENGTNISGGAGANFQTGLPGQTAGQTNKAQKSSGSYANIQSYLDANKDQGDQMGQTIAGNIDQKATDAQSKVQGLATKAPQVQAYDPNTAYSKLGSLSDDDKNQYRTYKSTGGYSGPDSIDKVDGYQDAQKSEQEAYGMVKNAGNEYGQQALLKDTYKRPQYSAGENRLDQVLLQNSAGSKQALQNVSSKYAGLDKLFQDTSSQVGGAINQANQTALANKENIANAETDQWNNLMNPIQARADQMNRDNPQLINSISDDLKDDTLNEQTLQRLGLTEGTKLYNTNLSSYFNPNLTQVGLNDVANDQERSKYQALADLVGDPSRTQINNQGQAINPIGFDKAAFDKDVAARQSEYENAYNTTTGDHFLDPAYFAQGNVNDGARSATVKHFQEDIMPYYDQLIKSGEIDQYQGERQKYDLLKKSLDSFYSQYGKDRVIKKG